MASALLATTALGAGAIAAPAAAQAQEARSYDIPAGSLAVALNRFAETANVKLFYDSSLTNGLSSPGLKGSFGTAEALSRLLAGTGLTFRQNGAGVFNLERAPQSADGAIQLGPVRVEGAGSSTTSGYNRPIVTSDPAATERTGSYTTHSMNTATGLALSPRHTPQSVSVVTNQQIEDFNFQTLEDAFRASPGISTQSGSAATNDGQIYARGFRIQNITIDGLALDLSNFNAINVSADLTMFDRVEVVRGATGLMDGAGTPSASVNLVRKRPTSDLLLDLSASLGSWNKMQVNGDISHRLTANGAIRARVAGSWREADSFVDVVQTRNGAAYGIIEADLGPKTTLSFGASYQTNHSKGLYRGHGVYADGSHMYLPRSTYLGNASDFYDQSTETYFADIRHDISDRWKVTAAVIQLNALSESRYGINYRTSDANVLLREGDGWSYGTDQLSAMVRVNGAFDLLGREHKIAFGATYRKQDSDGEGTWLDNPDVAQETDVSNWNPYSDPDVIRASDPLTWRFVSIQKGLYAAGDFHLAAPFHIVAGGRLSWFEDKQKGWYAAALVPQRKENAQFTPYLSALLDLGKNHTLYASYTSIFEPQSVVDKDGNALKPITGTNYEVGLKGEYFDGKLNASAALFLIKQQNRSVDDLDSPNPCPGYTSGYCQRAAGEIESKGIDVQVFGELLLGWQVSAGYTYAIAKYTKDDTATLIGMRLNTRDPEHQFKLFSSYRFGGALEGLSINASVHAQSKIWIVSGTTFRSEQGAYAIAGAGIGYVVNDHLSIRANVENLFDKKYYRDVGNAWSATGDYYGNPRNFLITARFRY